MVETRRAAIGVWAVIAGVSLIEPASHLWIAYFPPEGTVPTGMHIPDSVIFLHGMAMFDNGFFSPYATCQAPLGSNSYRYFCVPFLWMYGFLGIGARAAGMSDFMALGIANGAGVFLAMAAVYLFLREAAREHANLAAILYVLGGGLGGLLWLATGALGLHERPDFEAYFERYALYELIEGPRLQPWLIAPRLYYTLPLALGFFSLRALLRGAAARNAGPLAIAGACLFGAGLINLRFGPFVYAIALVYLAAGCPRKPVWRARIALLLGVCLGVAVGINVWMLSWNPIYGENAFLLIRRAMWLAPFLSVTFLFWIVLPGELRRTVAAMPRGFRACGWAAFGYLAAYAALYVAHHAYYGVFWRSADFGASLWLSDWALIGAGAGAIAGYGRRSRGGEADPRMQWIALWFLAFLCIAISAWGQGWFIRLAPQRLMVFLGPPMCLLAAAGIGRMRARHSRLSVAIPAAIVILGTLSMGVTALAFQGPLGLEPGRGPYAWNHAEVMLEDDARCLEALGAGTVLAPTGLPAFGDILSLRGAKVLHGFGAWDLSDVAAQPISKVVDDFFAPGARAEERLEIAREWCIDWVYCPATVPVAAEIRRALRELPWLESVAQSGEAELFRVRELP